MSDAVTRAQVQKMLAENRRLLLLQLCEVVGRADGDKTNMLEWLEERLRDDFDACPHIRQAREQEALNDRALSTTPKPRGALTLV